MPLANSYRVVTTGSTLLARSETEPGVWGDEDFTGAEYNTIQSVLSGVNQGIEHAQQTGILICDSERGADTLAREVALALGWTIEPRGFTYEDYTRSREARRLAYLTRTTATQAVFFCLNADEAPNVAVTYPHMTITTYTTT